MHPVRKRISPSPACGANDSGKQGFILGPAEIRRADQIRNRPDHKTPLLLPELCRAGTPYSAGRALEPRGWRGLVRGLKGWRLTQPAGRARRPARSRRLACAFIRRGYNPDYPPLLGLISPAGSFTPWREKPLISFFGIRGMGSIYYLAFALNQTALPDRGGAGASSD